MTKNICILISTALLLYSCGGNLNQKSSYVKDHLELNEALKNAGPGDEIVMADGDWEDVQIRFVGYGKKGQPITLRAETAGAVTIKGKSDLKLGGGVFGG